MRHIISAAAVVLMIVPAMAQQSELARTEAGKDARISLVHTGKDTVVYNILKDDRPIKFRDAPVPHFAIHTKDNKFIMTIGGQINPIIGWDLGNELYEQAGAGNGFVTQQIPVPAPQFKRSDFFIDALNAYVDFQVVGFGGTRDQITGYIKIGPDGYSSPIKLKRAYVKWRGITAGLKKTLLQDDYACQPPTIDPQGPCGMVSTSSYEISYMSPSFHGFRAVIGLDFPTFNSSNGHYLGKDYKAWNGEPLVYRTVCDPTAYNQMVPDIPLWIEWAKSDVNRIRLSGLIRTLNYRDMLAEKRRTAVGWGIMLSGNFSPVDPLIFYAQAIYGKGIGQYIQDMAGVPLSFTPKSENPGEMTPTPQMGIVGGVTYNINKRWQVNAMYSMARMWDVGAYALDESEGENNAGEFSNYRYCNYVAANVFYNISSFFQVGVEYLYGQRHTWYRGQAHDNRIQAQFSFKL